MPDDGAADNRLHRRLSICIVACKDLSLNTRAIRQAGALAEAGHQVTIVAFRTPDPRLAAGGAVATLIATGWPGFPIRLMSGLWLRRFLQRSDTRKPRSAAADVAALRSRNGRFARRVVNRLKKDSFDVVQAHFDKSLIAASALARRCGARLVFDAVEFPFDAELLPGGAITRMARLAEIDREAEIARQADGWITINDTFADSAVIRFGVARPLVLRNIPDHGYRPSDGRLRRDLGLPNDACILLHLNTMRRGEGLETAIEALAQLPAGFHLVGLGPLPTRGFAATMRQQAAERGVADRFHIAPMQPPHALPAYIAGADIGVIARQGQTQNLRLSLPNRLFQMIAARLPIVATPLPEISRLVREWEVGLVVGESDAAGMAAAIRHISEPATLARFRDAADRAARSLTWERESASYVKFIERLGIRATAGFDAQPGCLERVAGEC